jgi:hypothetical protein
MRDPAKLQVTFLGLKINAEGAFAICAALIMVLAALAFYRF